MPQVTISFLVTVKLDGKTVDSQLSFTADELAISLEELSARWVAAVLEVQMIRT